MRTTTKNLLTLLGALALLGPAACKEAPKGSTSAPPAAPSSGPSSAPGAKSAGPALPLSAEETAQLQPLLGDYEALRALLADDKTEGVAAAAGRLEARATELAAGGPAGAKARLEKISAQAKALAEASGESMKASRLAFGELSREVVGLLAAAPSLQAGLHVFECGMADGYQKWVQPAEELENPYMGHAMLACGSKTSWD